MIGTRCRVSCDISIPNIYVRGKPSPQVKANDVVVYERTAVKKCRLFAKLKTYGDPMSDMFTDDDE